MRELPEAFRDPYLATAVEGHVNLITRGHIHGLEVEVSEGRIHVSGQAETFSEKYLVLDAVLQVIGVNDPELVDLDIQVVDSGSIPQHHPAGSY